MKNIIKEFINSELGTVKVIMVNEDPYFSLPDICRALDIASPGNKTRELKKLIMQGILPENTLFLTQGIHMMRYGREVSINIPVHYVSEAGMYMTICGSEKKAAKKFLAWICNSVLPSIRKNGGYINGQEYLPNEEREALENEIKLLRKAKASLEGSLFSTQEELSELEDQYEELRRSMNQDGFVLLDGVLVKANDADLYDDFYSREHQSYGCYY